MDPRNGIEEIIMRIAQPGSEELHFWFFAIALPLCLLIMYLCAKLQQEIDEEVANDG